MCKFFVSTNECPVLIKRFTLIDVLNPNLPAARKTRATGTREMGSATERSLHFRIPLKWLNLTDFKCELSLLPAAELDLLEPFT